MHRPHPTPVPSIHRTTAAAVAVALAAGSAGAWATSPGAPAPARIEIVAPAPLPDHALAELAGRFELADGRTLTVAHHGRHLFAAIGKRRPVLLEALGGHRFAMRDGRATVAFEPSADGPVDRLRLWLPAPPDADSLPRLGE